MWKGRPMRKTVAAMAGGLAIALCFTGWAGAESKLWKNGYVRPSGSAVDPYFYEIGNKR